MPVCAVCRSKYGEYPEYHTSADDLSLISEEGLQGTFHLMKKCIRALEYNYCYSVNFLCEPCLGKRGLYPTISQKGTYDDVAAMLDFLAYADGQNDLISISDKIHVPIDALIPIIEELMKNELIDY